MTHMTILHHWRRWLLILVVGLVVAGMWAGYHTWQAVHQLRQWQFASTSSHAQQALWVVTPLSVGTAHLSPDIEVWHQGLRLLATTDHTAQQAQTYVQAFLQTESAPSSDIQQVPSQLLNQLEAANRIATLIPRTLFLRHWLKIDQPGSRFQTAANLIRDAQTVLTHLATGQHTYVVLFQNSHELRATGGFMGSYAQVTVTDGQLTAMNIHDIYEPDGQFTGYVEPPAGIKEYVSSGHGLRLPDANWSPDFPTSAQRILTYFALGEKNNVEGVVAVNLSLAERLLAITGDIFVPDYQLTVTAANLPEVARADRATFFPGSQQKPQFLRALFTQLKLKIATLSPEQRQQLLTTLSRTPRQKELQLFSTVPELQTVWHTHHLAGEYSLRPAATTHDVHTPSNQPLWSVGLVESNVGINKANAGIERAVNITIGATHSRVEVTFHNTNAPASPLITQLTTQQKNQAEVGHYVNYQRLFLPTTFHLEHLRYQGQDITQWDEEIMTTSQGEQLTQIGFLLTLPTQHTGQLEIELTHPEFTQPPMVFIPMQAGLPPTPYTITKGQQTQTEIVDSDLVLQ